VSFHNFSLLEDPCVRLLIKNLSRQMPQDIDQEESENLGICVLAVLQLHSGRHDQDASKDLPLTLHFIVLVSQGPEVAKFIL
jgi:hypothetical protein